MAVRDEIREQRNSLKGQGVKAHLSYFWDYYKVPFFVVLLVLATLAYLITSIVTAKKTVFTAYFLNAGEDVSGEKAKSMSREFGQIIGYDPEKEDVVIDLARSIQPGNLSSQEAVSFSTVLTSGLQAGQVAACVMDAWNFNSMAELGTFINLHQVLSDEEFEALGDDVFYVDAAQIHGGSDELDPEAELARQMTTEEALAWETKGKFVRPDPSQMQEAIPVGIRVSEYNKITENNLYPDAEAFFGFCLNRGDYTNAKRMLEFLKGN